MKGAWVGLRMIFRAFFSHSDGVQTLRLAIEERNREIRTVGRGSRLVDIGPRFVDIRATKTACVYGTTPCVYGVCTDVCTV